MKKLLISLAVLLLSLCIIYFTFPKITDTPKPDDKKVEVSLLQKIINGIGNILNTAGEKTNLASVSSVIGVSSDPIYYNPMDDGSSGKVGTARTFNGTSDFASASLGNPLPSSLTVSVWVKPTSFPYLWSSVFSRQASTNDWKDAHFIGIKNNGSVAAGGRNSTFTPEGAIPLDGNWHHIVAVMSDSQTKIYVDGSVKATGSVADLDRSSTKPDIIGAGMNEDNANKNEFFSGSMDELRVYDRMLSESEISSLYSYTGGTNPNPTPTPTASITASPTSITSGGSTTITWNSQNATGCTVTKNGSAWQTGTSGAQSSGALTANTTFAVSCSGASGTTPGTGSVVVTVTGGSTGCGDRPLGTNVTINACSPSYAHVSAAVTAAQDGDTVVVPAGTATWSQTLNISKAITIQGSGMNSTKIILSAVSPLIQISSVSGNVRVSGIHFQLHSGWDLSVDRTAILVRGPSHNVRIDNNKFQYGKRPVYFSGYNKGVVDHNSFVDTDLGIYITGEEAGDVNSGDRAWTRPLQPGTSDAVFVEDNTFLFTSAVPQENNEIWYTWWGARGVFRHNTATWQNTASAALFDHHGRLGNWRASAMSEIYNNTFNVTAATYRISNFRGGRVMIFNNVVNGANAPWSFRREINGIPGIDDIQNSHWWNNTTNGVAAGYSNPDGTVVRGTHILNRAPQQGDVFYPYTPYCYPHPLVSGTSCGTTPNPTTYSITTSPGANGTITSSESLTGITRGSDRTITIAPSPGYQVASVTVNGSSVGAVTSYTISNITSNHTVSATFSLIPTGNTINCSGDITTALQTAVNNASVGGTVNVGAGSCTLTSPITLTRGVTLKGAGRDSTFITSNDVAVNIIPTSLAISNEEKIQVEGFDFNGNNQAAYILAVFGAGSNASKPYKNLAILNNRIRNAKPQESSAGAIYIKNHVRGVISGNDFDRVNVLLKLMGNDDYREWSNPAYVPFTYGLQGNGDNLYFENNTIRWSSILSGVYSQGWIESGQGSRVVVRYNSWDMKNAESNYDNLWDIHGFQGWKGGNNPWSSATTYTIGTIVSHNGVPWISRQNNNLNHVPGNNDWWGDGSGQTGTMIVEYYGNTVTNGNFGKLIAHRGSWGLFYNNIIQTSKQGSIAMTQYFPYSTNQYAPMATTGSVTGLPFFGVNYISQVNNTYIFNNTNYGTEIVPYWNDGQSPYNWPQVIKPNENWWNYNSSLNSSPNSSSLQGVGRGTTAPTGSCVTGNAYWVSSTPTPTTNASVIQNSSLYKCIGGTWSLYYQPYTYPHPLVGGVIPPNPNPTTHTLSVTKQGTGTGTVSGGSISCGSICSQSGITNQTSITLTATPSSGSTFTGWGGDCSGTGSCVLNSIASSKNVTATFNTATIQTINPGSTLAFTIPDSSVQFNLVTGGDYSLSGLVNAPGDASNSFFIDVNNTNTNPGTTGNTHAWGIPLTTGFSTSTVTSWSTGLLRIFALSSGLNTLYVNTRESGTQIQSVTFNKLNSDTTPPTVSITLPTNSSTITGTSTNLSADAIDPLITNQVQSGIARVDFKVNGTVIGSDTTAPYAGVWSGMSNGTYTLTAVATDVAGNITTSSSVTATVNNVQVNNPPVLSTIGNKNVFEAAPLQFTVSASDPNGDALIYSVTNLPSGATFNQTSKAFSWTPNYTQAGTYTSTFSVSDQKGGVASETITITVVNVNRTPTVSISTGQEASTLVQLSAVVSDQDNDPITYKWTKTSGGGVTWSPSDTASEVNAILDPNHLGSYTFRVTVSDGKGGTAFEEYTSNDTSPDSDNDSIKDTSDRCPATPSTNRPTNLAGCPLPKVTEFSTKSPAALTDTTANTDLKAITTLELGNSSGKITWNTTGTTYSVVNPTTYAKLDIDAGIHISQGEISMDSALLTGLNKRATLTFYNISSNRKKITKDDTICTSTGGVSTCSNITYNNGTLSFTVDGFSTYEVVDAPPLTVSITTSSNTSRGEAITLTATPSDTNINSISFYEGSTLLGTDTTSPYTLSITPGMGSHSYKAIANDPLGFTATSNEVTVTGESTGGTTSGTTVGTYSPSVGGGAITIYTNQSTNTSNCTATTLFDRMTGARCPSTTNTSPNTNNQNTAILALSLKNNGVPAGFRFNKNLKLNANSLDVANLQRFLNLNGYTVATKGFGSIGLENKKFGPATRAALIKFQKANKIIPAVGYFGPTTRKVMNAKLNAIGL